MQLKLHFLQAALQDDLSAPGLFLPGPPYRTVGPS